MRRILLTAQSVVVASLLLVVTGLLAPPSAAASDLPVVQQADGNRGIVFGTPVSAGQNMVAVLATNSTEQVKSFTVKATYKTGNRITATAIGAVNDLRPGQRRAATLMSMDSIPQNFDSVRVDVDTMVREASATGAADAATLIVFGEPTVKRGFLPMLDAEVTNQDSSIHSFTVQATFLKGGQLVAVMSGAVNDLAAGQTKTATMMSQGSSIPEYDEVLLAVDTLVA